jgi:hypothetical protein
LTKFAGPAGFGASNLPKTPFSGSKESTVQIRNVLIADKPELILTLLLTDPRRTVDSGLLQSLHMVSPRTRFRLALWISSALIVCSLTVSYLLYPEPAAGMVLAPGIFVGLVASVLTSGNPHGGSFTTIIPFAVATNFPFYLAISYAALAFWSKVSKPKQ